METSTWLSQEQIKTLRIQLERSREELRVAAESAADEIPRLRLASVQAALMRFETGTYGECTRCEEPLPFEKLRERPEAAICTACQSERRNVRAAAR
jgi:RNA polymerase-binding transcription factor DksA